MCAQSIHTIPGRPEKRTKKHFSTDVRPHLEGQHVPGPAELVPVQVAHEAAGVRHAPAERRGGACAGRRLVRTLTGLDA